MANDVAAQTMKIIAEQLELEPGTITRDTPLDEIGVASLKLVEIVMELEDQFGINIDLNAAEAFANYKTVGNIVDEIGKLAGAQS